MKRSLALAGLLLALPLAGCVQTQMETVIEKNGSGTFALSFSMSETVAAAVEEMRGMDMPGQQDMDDAPSLDSFDQEKIEAACKKHSVELTKFERKTVEGKESIELAMKFDNVNDLSASLNDGLENTGSVQLLKNPEGNYLLSFVEGDDEEVEDAETPPAPQDMQEYDPEQMGKAMELMGKMMAEMNSLDIGMRITVPGEVLEHNAMRQEGNTLIWEINAQNMMSAGGQMQPDILFSGEGLNIEAPAVE